MKKEYLKMKPEPIEELNKYKSLNRPMYSTNLNHIGITRRKWTQTKQDMWIKYNQNLLLPWTSSKNVKGEKFGRSVRLTNTDIIDSIWNQDCSSTTNTRHLYTKLEKENQITEMWIPFQKCRPMSSTKWHR